MHPWIKHGRRATLALLLATATQAACAAELKVLSTGAFKQVVAAMVPLYEARSGNKVVLENDTAGGLAKKIAAGASFDLLILTPSLVKDLVTQQKVAAATVVNLASVGIGVMVPDGAAPPAIATVEQFKQALMEAKSVAYIDPASGGSSGIYLVQLLKQWGMFEQIKQKAVLVQGGHVADKLVAGQAVLGIHQISEILPVKGVTLVGPLPPAIQNYTVYTAAVASATAQREAALAFLQLLSGPEAAQVLRDKGMQAAP